jgi:RNA polymerase sigma-70 factor (sigma-E family)
VGTNTELTGPGQAGPGQAGPGQAGPEPASPDLADTDLADTDLADTDLADRDLADAGPAEQEPVPAGGFAEFVAARERALLGTAWLLTGDWGLAEDLVQTALVRSWPRWERIKRRDDPEVYVRRVIVNTWSTWLRRRWRGEQPALVVPERPGSADVAAEVTTRMAVRDALATLTDRQRAVVVLRVFDDMSESQVADVLGCSAGNVKSTLSRALAKLRERLPIGDFVEGEDK